MSFEMSNIKRRKKVTNIDFKEYYSVIYSRTILTDNVKTALKEYLRFRLFKRSSKITVADFNNMIIELLENIIHKDNNKIILEDVINNEEQLLYEIAKAIYSKSLHSLIYKGNNNLLDMKPLTNKTQIKPSDVEDYYRSLMK